MTGEQKVRVCYWIAGVVVWPIIGIVSLLIGAVCVKILRKEI